MQQTKKTLQTLLLACAVAATLTSCRNAGTETPESKPEEKGTAAAAPSKPVKAPEATGPRRILFVGNSHTSYYVNLPEMFGNLCQFNHNDFKEEEVVEMGISLEEIYSGYKKEVAAASARTDADGNYYDYIVLQEKTPVAAGELEAYKASVKKFMADLHKNSPGAVLLVYEVMSPADYDKETNDYEHWAGEMKKNATAVVNDNDNSKLFRLAEAITAAYKGDNSYSHTEAGKDRLRLGEGTLHMLNDGGFLAATLLYATIFDKAPAIPEQMSFSTGADAEGIPNGQKEQPVKTAVSNPDALLKIAMAYK